MRSAPDPTVRSPTPLSTVYSFPKQTKTCRTPPKVRQKPFKTFQIWSKRQLTPQSNSLQPNNYLGKVSAEANQMFPHVLGLGIRSKLFVVLLLIAITSIAIIATIATTDFLSCLTSLLWCWWYSPRFCGVLQGPRGFQCLKQRRLISSELGSGRKYAVRLLVEQ